MDADELMVARITTTIVAGGRRYPIRRGETVVHRDDPVVRGRERLFRPLKVTRLGARPTRPAARALETATAGPGEVRGPVLPPAQPEPDEPDGDVFDPSAHTVAQVNAYLADVDVAEQERVLQAEAEGQGRRGILSGPYADPAGA